MNRRGRAKGGTLALLRQWTRDVHRHEQIIRALWWRNPVSTLRKLRRATLEERLRMSIKELGRRYQGALYEILETAGISEDQRVGAHLKVWQMTQAEVRRNPQPRAVPGLLWAFCRTFESPGASLPERLKRKLALRAFIEEAPDSPEREELLRLAYQEQGEAFQMLDPDEEALGRLSRFYPVFYEVLRKTRHLAEWSDGALSPKDISAMSPPYADFDEWLFEMSQPRGAADGIE
jgi:hypothetical protein